MRVDRLRKIFGRRWLPAESRPAFDREERLLAWAMSGSDVVVATNLGLWWGGRRTGWHDIAKAVWDRNVLSITPVTVLQQRPGYLVIEDAPIVRLPLADPGGLPDQVRSRVTGSVTRSQHADLPGGGVWLAARRLPGMDGLTWVARFDPGTDRNDPEILAYIDGLAESEWNAVTPAG